MISYEVCGSGHVSTVDMSSMSGSRLQTKPVSDESLRLNVNVIPKI
jgi:hypothetical protein